LTRSTTRPLTPEERATLEAADAETVTPGEAARRAGCVVPIFLVCVVLGGASIWTSGTFRGVPRIVLITLAITLITIGCVVAHRVPFDLYAAVSGRPVRSGLRRRSVPHDAVVDVTTFTMARAYLYDPTGDMPTLVAETEDGDLVTVGDQAIDDSRVDGGLPRLVRVEHLRDRILSVSFEGALAPCIDVPDGMDGRPPFDERSVRVIRSSDVPRGVRERLDRLSNARPASES